MQQFNQFLKFLFFVPNFFFEKKKFIKSKKQKFFVFVGSHSTYVYYILCLFLHILKIYPEGKRIQILHLPPFFQKIFAHTVQPLRCCEVLEV